LRIDRATAGGHLFTVSHFFNVSFNKILDFCWVDLARLIVTNLQNHKSESNELLRFSQYLRNSTSQYVFVFFFVDVFLIVMRLENQLNFFDYSFLSVKFFQELKIKFVYTIITPLLRRTLSLTCISTAEFGNSSKIFKLSSSSLTPTCFVPTTTCLQKSLTVPRLTFTRDSLWFFIEFTRRLIILFGFDFVERRSPEEGVERVLYLRW
jgi:hypothetical protein